MIENQKTLEISESYPEFNIQIQSIYGVEMIKFNNYSPDLIVTTKHFKTVFFTDPIKNIIAYNVDEIDFKYYGNASEHIQLNKPNNIIALTDGNVYVSDSGNNRILNLFWNSQEIINHQNMYTGLSNPHGIAVDAKNNLYIADTGNNRIVKLNSTLNPVNYIGQNTSFLVKPALIEPKGIAVDGFGNIYVGCTGSKSLLKFDAAGQLIKSIFSTEINLSELNITDIKVDQFDNIYVIDNFNSLLIKFDNNLNVLARIGGVGEQIYNLNRPMCLTLYREYGGIFVSTSEGGKIFRIMPGLGFTDKYFSRKFVFKTELKISEYRLTSTSLVNIMILDNQANVIRLLSDNKIIFPGVYIINWDGRNDRGQSVTEGEYVLQIVAQAAVNNVKKIDFDTVNFDETQFNFYFKNSYGQEIKKNIVKVTPPQIIFKNNPSWPIVNAGNQSLIVNYNLSTDAFSDFTIFGSTFNEEVGLFYTDFHEIKNLYNDFNIGQRVSGDYSITWDGKSDNSQQMPDGIYFIGGLAKTLEETGMYDYLKIGIDLIPIKLESFQVAEAFSPRKNQLNVTYSVNENAYVDAIIQNSKYRTIKKIFDKKYIKAGQNSFSWDGIDTAGYYAPEGKYIVKLTVTDLTSNSKDTASLNF